MKYVCKRLYLGGTNMRDQIFNWYIKESQYYKPYIQYKMQSTTDEGFDCKELENHIDKCRRENKIELLIPMLILVAKYYIKSHNYQLATIYFIECYEVLKRMNYQSRASLYVLMELGILQRDNSEYTESLHYFSRAIDYMMAQEDDAFIEFCYQNVTELTVLSRSKDRLKNYYGQIKKQGINLSEEVKVLLDIEFLYAHKNYEQLMAYLNTLKESEHELSPSLLLVLKQRECCINFKLQQVEAINWLSKEEEWLLMHHSMSHYYFEYEFIKLYKTSNLEKLEQQLLYSKQYYSLDLFYELMTELHEDELYEIKRQKNKEKLFIKEQTLKDRLQNIHLNYKNYYRQHTYSVTSVHYHYVNKEKFITMFEKQYSQKTVLLAFNIESYFLMKIPDEIVEFIVQKLAESIGDSVVVSTFDGLIWCYYEQGGKNLRIKQKINRIVRDLYDEIHEKFGVMVCLPTNLPQSFELAQRYIYEVLFLDQFNSKEIQNFTINYYSPQIMKTSPAMKAFNLIEELDQNNKITLKKQMLYDSRQKQIHGVRCDLFIDSLALNECLSKNEDDFVKKMLTIEKEVKTCELACKEVANEHFKGKLFLKLSKESLTHKFIIPRLLKCFEIYEVNVDSIIFEVHEETLFEGDPVIDWHVKMLIEYGFHLSLDEYGQGAQTGSLQNIPISYLKLSDPLFELVKNDENNQKILDTVKALCTKKHICMYYMQDDSEPTHQFLLNFGINIAGGKYYH